MSLGIGKYCQICDSQLDYGVGFNADQTVCNVCLALIPKVIDYLTNSMHDKERI